MDSDSRLKEVPLSSKTDATPKNNMSPAVIDIAAAQESLQESSFTMSTLSLHDQNESQEWQETSPKGSLSPSSRDSTENAAARRGGKDKGTIIWKIQPVIGCCAARVKHRLSLPICLPVSIYPLAFLFPTAILQFAIPIESQEFGDVLVRPGDDFAEVKRRAGEGEG